MLQFHAEKCKRLEHGVPQNLRHISEVFCGTLLGDGQFAFVMVKEHEDLRHYIDRVMLATPNNLGPFSKGNVEEMIY